MPPMAPSSSCNGLAVGFPAMANPIDGNGVGAVVEESIHALQEPLSLQTLDKCGVRNQAWTCLDGSFERQDIFLVLEPPKQPFVVRQRQHDCFRPSMFIDQEVIRFNFCRHRHRASRKWRKIFTESNPSSGRPYRLRKASIREEAWRMAWRFLRRDFSNSSIVKRMAAIWRSFLSRSLA